MTTFERIKTAFAENFRVEPSGNWHHPTRLAFDLLAKGEEVRLGLSDEDLFLLADLLAAAARERRLVDRAAELADWEREAG